MTTYVRPTKFKINKHFAKQLATEFWKSGYETGLKAGEWHERAIRLASHEAESRKREDVLNEMLRVSSAMREFLRAQYKDARPETPMANTAGTWGDWWRRLWNG